MIFSGIHRLRSSGLASILRGLLLALATLLVPGTASAEGEPHELVDAVIEALRGSDTAALVGISLGPDGLDEARREWSESEAERLAEITEQDRAEFAGMIGMLTAPGAEELLMGMLEPQLAEWGANLAALAAMLQGMGSMQVQQMEDITDEEKANLNAALQAAASWAATSDLASPDKAREAIGMVAATARGTGLATLDDLARLEFDQLLGLGDELMTLAWKLLGLYGLPVEELLASMRSETLDNDGERALVRTRFDFLGTEQHFDTELVNVDGKWVSASARDGIAALTAPGTEAAAAGVVSGQGTEPDVEETLKWFFSTLEASPTLGALQGYLSADLVDALGLLSAERRGAVLEALQAGDIRVVSRFTMNGRSELAIESGGTGETVLQGEATLVEVDGGWLIDSVQWQGREPFDAATVAMLGATAAAETVSSSAAPPAAGEPGLGVQQAVEALKANDIGALVRAVIGEQAFEEARQHWVEQRETRLSEISEEDRAGFAGFMAMLTAPGSEEALMAMLEPQLAEWSANLAALVGMLQGMAAMQVQQMEGLSDDDRQQLNQALQAAAQWAASGELTSPDKAREAIAMVTARARVMGIDSLDRLAGLEFDELLGVGSELLALTRELLAHYNLPLEELLDSITTETVSNDGRDAVVITRFRFLGTEQSVETRLTNVDGEWVSADAAAGIEAMTALQSAADAANEEQAVSGPAGEPDGGIDATPVEPEQPSLQQQLDDNPFLQRHGIGLTVLEDRAGFVTVELTFAPEGLADAAAGGLDLVNLAPAELAAPADRLALTALQRAVAAVALDGRQVMLVPPTVDPAPETVADDTADAAVAAMLADAERARDEALNENAGIRQALEQLRQESAQAALQYAETEAGWQRQLATVQSDIDSLRSSLAESESRALEAERLAERSLARAEAAEAALAAARLELAELAAAEDQRARQEAERQHRRRTEAEAEMRALVQGIQSRLAELGYQPGPADGVAGAGTRNAIRQYQENAGLAVDGEASAALLEHMQSGDAPGAGPEPVETPAADSGTQAGAEMQAESDDAAGNDAGEPGKPTLKEKASGLFNKLLRRDNAE